MSENPYESPRAETGRPEVRSRRWSWFQDRFALIGAAFLVTGLIISGVLGVEYFRLPRQLIYVVVFGVIASVALLGRRRLR